MYAIGVFAGLVTGGVSDVLPAVALLCVGAGTDGADGVFMSFKSLSIAKLANLYILFIFVCDNPASIILIESLSLESNGSRLLRYKFLVFYYLAPPQYVQGLCLEQLQASSYSNTVE